MRGPHALSIMRIIIDLATVTPFVGYMVVPFALRATQYQNKVTKTNNIVDISGVYTKVKH